MSYDSSKNCAANLRNPYQLGLQNIRKSLGTPREETGSMVGHCMGFKLEGSHLFIVHLILGSDIFLFLVMNYRQQLPSYPSFTTNSLCFVCLVAVETQYVHLDA